MRLLFAAVCVQLSFGKTALAAPVDVGRVASIKLNTRQTRSLVMVLRGNCRIGDLNINHDEELELPSDARWTRLHNILGESEISRTDVQLLGVYGVAIGDGSMYLESQFAAMTLRTKKRYGVRMMRDTVGVYGTFAEHCALAEVSAIDLIGTLKSLRRRDRAIVIGILLEVAARNGSNVEATIGSKLLRSAVRGRRLEELVFILLDFDTVEVVE